MLLFIELVFKSLKCCDYHYVTKKCQDCKLTVAFRAYAFHPIWLEITNITNFTQSIDV
jgi:hypothetical protein